MYRDTLILLILKEIFYDPYLINIIYNIVLNDEILLYLDSHVAKSVYLMEDIQIMYPGFIKTALFENIRFDSQDDLEPGYSFYGVKPLTDCGYLINYNVTPPLKFPICEYSNYKKNTNAVTLINDVRKKYPLTKIGREKIKSIFHKRDIYIKCESKNKEVTSIWYDFENKIFTNV